MDQRSNQDLPPPPGFLVGIAQCVRFYSRIPIPALPGEQNPHAPPDIAMLPRALPFAALIIAAPACLALWVGEAIGFPAFVIAVLTVATLVLSTGAFHEDGLADCADGFGGGSTIARKLDIMKDSRLGTYGAGALCLSLLLRAAALAALLETRPLESIAALILAIAALSRMAGLLPLVLLAPARRDGASADLGRPPLTGVFIGFLLCALIIAIAAVLAEWPAGLGPALIFGAVAAGLGTAWLAARQIAGQTGDVAGAAQQAAEIACLLIPLATGFAR